VAIFYQGRPITIGTQGILRPDTPLTIGVQGILEPLFVGIDIDLEFGGESGVRLGLNYAVIDEPLEFAGTAAAIFVIGEQVIYTYAGGEDGQVTFGGTAIPSVGYPSEGGLVFNGEGELVFFEPVHVADGGIIFNGSADVDTVGIIDQRGGKGVPKVTRTKKIYAQREIFMYSAEALREHRIIRTPFGDVRKGHGTFRVGGAAQSYLIPPKFLLIKDLPKLPKQEPSEFLQFYADVAKNGVLVTKPPKQIFRYTSNGVIEIGGTTSVGYLDYGEVIIQADDEDLLMGMLDSLDDTYVSTVFDTKIKRIKGDDDELIELGIL
jgi:hypothetical protein